MNANRWARVLALLTVLFLTTSCAHTISREMRQKARKDLTFSAVLQNPSAYLGSTVIWGGVIIETLNRSDYTVITILQTPLDYQGYPDDEASSRGRFMARTSGYLDPEVYKKGRKVTLAGEIIDVERRPLGEIQYAYPVISIQELHLWEERRPYYYPPYYPPYYWYGPPYYYWPYRFHFHHHHPPHRK